MEPDCIDGDCPTSLNKLTPEILRAFWLRNVLTAFSELGIGQTVQELYKITREDLDLMALIISEERELEQVIRETEVKDHGS